MTAKEYLEQIELLDIKIEQKEEQLSGLRATAGGDAAIRYDKLKIQTTPSPDAMERNVIRIVELESKIFEDKCKLAHLKDQIVDQIQSLDDPRYIRVLYLRYVKYEKFEQIALDMSYDYTYTRALHGEALGMFEIKYSNILHNLAKK